MALPFLCISGESLSMVFLIGGILKNEDLNTIFHIEINRLSN